MIDQPVTGSVSLEDDYYDLAALQESLAQQPIYQYDEFDIPRLVITHEPEFAQTLGRFGIIYEGFIFL